jgi:hypothetical protein
METVASNTRDEVAIRELIDGFIKGNSPKTLTVFSSEVVSFDIGPPLQHGGEVEFMKRWRELFEAYEGPIDYEVRDLSIKALLLWFGGNSRLSVSKD